MNTKHEWTSAELEIITKHMCSVATVVQRKYLSHISYDAVAAKMRQARMASGIETKPNESVMRNESKEQGWKRQFAAIKDLDDDYKEREVKMPALIDFNIYAWRNGYELTNQMR